MEARRMKLVASLVTHNEAARYLEVCVPHLLEFCDAVYAFDDGSTDGTAHALHRLGAVVTSQETSTFFKHEGRTRQLALDWTLKGAPDYVLNVDLDEFVSDGPAIRRACESGHDAYGLTMMECWEATAEGLCIRVDGGWKPTRVPALWRVPTRTAGLRIADRALACGRVPTSVDRRGAHPIDADLVHFGWTNEAERVARHERYAVADGGRFHRSAHLDSILWGCDRVELEGMGWPAGLAGAKDAILAKVTSTESLPT
jgi:glycosyltransferase involved in cell wall biosynthesis